MILIILSAPFYDKEEELKKYSFHAKYVKHQNLWFIQSLVYPEEYSKAVVRLINLIDNWQIWEKEKPLFPERLQLSSQITSRREIIKRPNTITLD